MINNLSISKYCNSNLGHDGEPEKEDTSTHQAEKRKRPNYSKERKKIMMKWLNEHEDNPYPTDAQKEELGRQTGLSMNQVKVWFVDTRRVNLIFH